MICNQRTFEIAPIAFQDISDIGGVNRQRALALQSSAIVTASVQVELACGAFCHFIVRGILRVGVRVVLVGNGGVRTIKHNRCGSRHNACIGLTDVHCASIHIQCVKTI